MDLNIGQLKYNNIIKNEILGGKNKIRHIEDNYKKPVNNDEQRLWEVVNEFTSLLIQKMFASMRDTVPDEKFIDGGFAEDVFTDMLDSEVSKLGAKQENFAALNRLLYQQLTGDKSSDK